MTGAYKAQMIVVQIDGVGLILLLKRGSINIGCCFAHQIVGEHTDDLLLVINGAAIGSIEVNANILGLESYIGSGLKEGFNGWLSKV